MKLEDIGFYTLSDARAATATHTSSLQRCELLVTQRCNFNCPYCRKLKGREISYRKAIHVLRLWVKDGLQNVRFSGGEPTLWHPLVQCVSYCKRMGVKRIAVSTNGSADWETYDRLIKAGVNDFSVSLDACCAADSDIMTGKSGVFGRVIETLQKLADRWVYTTVGIVLTDQNIKKVHKIVRLAHSLGVSDIRVIPAAQYSKSLPEMESIMYYPILRYRLNNMQSGKSVRGLQETDNLRCPLVLDDMAVWNGHHYPCIIYLREGGAPIGKVSACMRAERFWWYARHNTHVDRICKNNCLDVCVDYNNRVRHLRETNRRNTAMQL